MKRLWSKILFAVLAAAIGVGVILYQQNRITEAFVKSRVIADELQALHAELISLQQKTLEANYFLYYNNDAIYEKIRNIETRLDTLLADGHLLLPEHVGTHRSLVLLKRHFRQLADNIDNFLLLNASLKNSSIYLPTLSLKAYDLFDINDPAERSIILTLSKVNAALFITKNALDESFLRELKHYRDALEKLMEVAETKAKRRLLRTSMRHLELFIDFFPKFNQRLDKILDNGIQLEIEKTMEIFSKESSLELGKISRIGEILLWLYLLSIAVVLYFVFHSEKEYIRLKRTQKELQRSLVVDHLTGLGNREAFRRELSHYEKPALILINIDRFKHINEFYGSKTGDLLLRAVAELLEKTVPVSKRARVFRLGGDDFGILFECSEPEKLENVVRELVEKFDETTFNIENLFIDISVSAGASTAGKLFETADMALKTVKSSHRKRYAIYDASLDVSETIANNIHALKQLKTAIANDAVIPFFQPIVDSRNGEVKRYEALARLRVAEEEVITPFFFIEAAKQAKLSGIITARILEHTLRIAERTGAAFSVNLSAEDIMSEHDKRQIFSLLEKNRAVAPSILFEILETEEIEDYETISEFIAEAKKYGCRVAIDDFGSGYSNFEKLLQLDIDIIKIDGSLIKNLDHDDHAELVVRTIVDFARGAGLRTVAEFVHSEAVYRKIRELGINYAQGYYLGEPRPPEFYFKS